ncbi:hypothetical protein SEVIR_7G076300v4 [Setaria viridis]|uniref:BHLH domain-containing protein n=1 Tax=Setaria viridis TaxID=4556 RepID=A0A4U6TMM5_SETVI|nr:transcription factor BHLH156-like [Setaria viridis]TKW03938.1 hypothetical protein SEVIR_7G076300v2 [Setaria viridis]
MEHELLQMLHLPPHELGQDHLTVSAAFFDVHGDAHFPGSGGGFAGAVADDDCSWVEDLMQLGDELFGGAGAGCDDNNAAGMDEGNRHPWQWNGGDGSPPSVEQGAGELASEPHRDDDGGDGDGASPVTRKRRDRSKTIVSERKRRVRMKEKLYELRSLVPNITKMDKASIIADAVVYVKNLQAHARKLKEEVSALEAQPRSPRQGQQQQRNRRAAAAAAAAGRRRQERDEDNGTAASGARVTHLGAAQVGEGRFFVTVECERRDGVAAPLCAAVESLACFRVETSSLVRSGTDRVVSTLTLKVNEQVGDASVCEGSVVKLLVMAALLKEGFRPEAAVEIS